MLPGNDRFPPSLVGGYENEPGSGEGGGGGGGVLCTLFTGRVAQAD